MKKSFTIALFCLTSFAQAQTDAERRWKFYQFMSGRNLKSETAPAPASQPAATVDQQP